MTRPMPRDRLIELIEHGGRQDVDVAALRDLARRVESARGEGYDACLYFGMYHKPCGDCPAFSVDCDKAMLDDIAKRIRNAVEGAPKSDTDREAAADWLDEEAKR